MRYRPLPMLGLALMLMSCATRPASAPPTPTPATEAKPAACAEFKPIIFSRQHDTEETIKQVKAHNAAWDALCGDAPAG